jgi:NADH:ubiquinone oxidoreductase subunit 2 (subunit N)
VYRGGMEGVREGLVTLEAPIVGGFLAGYLLLLCVFFSVFWRWGTLGSFQGLVVHLRQGRGIFWQRLVILSLVSFSGLPPLFFFFSKLGLLAYLLQVGAPLVGLMALLFVCLGWFVYFAVLRWISLTHTPVGFTWGLVEGLHSSRVTLLWVFLSLLLGAAVFFLDDLVVVLLWLAA